MLEVAEHYQHFGGVSPINRQMRELIPLLDAELRDAFGKLPEERRRAAALVYTAHSVPVSMAANSRYEMQLREACRLVSERLNRQDWRLVFQSRSGPPSQPWLGPDIGDSLRELH